MYSSWKNVWSGLIVGAVHCFFGNLSGTVSIVSILPVHTQRLKWGRKGSEPHLGFCFCFPYFFRFCSVRQIKLAISPAFERTLIYRTVSYRIVSYSPLISVDRKIVLKVHNNAISITPSPNPTSIPHLSYSRCQSPFTHSVPPLTQYFKHCTHKTTLVV